MLAMRFPLGRRERDGTNGLPRGLGQPSGPRHQEAARARASVRVWTGPLEGPALRRIARFADRVIVVVPKVTSIFDDFQQALPWYTRLLIFTSDVFTGYWWLLLMLGGGAAYAFRRWLATPAGRATWDRRILGVPLFGKLL